MEQSNNILIVKQNVCRTESVRQRNNKMAAKKVMERRNSILIVKQIVCRTESVQQRTKTLTKKIYYCLSH